MGFQNELKPGQSSRRDSLRISGTGCICLVPELETWTKDGKQGTCLNIRVVSNDVSKGKVYGEYTDIKVYNEEWAKKLAGFLQVGCVIEFSGDLRTKVTDSPKYFGKLDSGAVDLASPAPMYRVACTIGGFAGGRINVMKWPSAERKAENVAAAEASGQAARTGTPNLQDVPNLVQAMETMRQLQTMMASMGGGATGAIVDLPPESQVNSNVHEGGPVDDEIPF